MVIIPLLISLWMLQNPRYVHANSDITLLHYDVDIVFMGMEKKLAGTVFIKFKAGNATTSMEVSHGQFDFHGGAYYESINAPALTDLTYDTYPSYYLLHFNKTLTPGAEYTVTLDWTLHKWKSIENLYSYNDGECYYVVTALADRGIGQIFPIYREKVTVNTNFSVDIGKQEAEARVAFIGPSTSQIHEATKDRFEYQVPHKIPVHLINFIIRKKLKKTAVALDGKFGFKVFARTALKSDSNTDLYDYVARKFCDGFKELGAFLNTRHPYSNIKIFLLPKLRKTVVDTVGVIYMPEEMVNEFTRKSLELDNMIADKVLNQFFGVLAVPRTREDEWLFAGVKRFIKFTSYLLPTEYLRVLFMKGQLKALFDNGWGITSSISSSPLADFVGPKVGSMVGMASRLWPNVEMIDSIRTFFLQYKHEMTTPADFLANLDPLQREMIYAWYTMPRFPILNVFSVKDQPRIGQDTIKVNHTYFRYDHVTDDGLDAKSTAIFPIKLFNLKDYNIHYYGSFANGTHVNPYSFRNDTPVVVISEHGFYRVNYDDYLWQKIEKQLNTGLQVFVEDQRAKLIDDAFTLARVGLLPYSRAFGLVEYLANEQSLLVWEVFFENMKFFTNIAKGYGSGLRPYIADYVALKIKPILEDRFDHRNDIAMKLSCLAKIKPCEKIAYDIVDLNAVLMDPATGIRVGCRAATRTEHLDAMLAYLNDTTNVDFDKRYYYTHVIVCTDGYAIHAAIVSALFLRKSTMLSDYERMEMFKYIYTYSSMRLINIAVEFLIATLDDESDDLRNDEVKDFIMTFVHRITDEQDRIRFSVLLEKAHQEYLLSTKEVTLLNNILDHYLYWNENYAKIVRELFIKYSDDGQRGGSEKVK